MHAGQGQFTNYFLDTYVAHKISELTKCTAPECINDEKWLNSFILNSVFRTQIPTKPKAYIFNFLRRVEGAFKAYQDALAAINEYLSTPSHIISPYFQALNQLEICISQSYQAYELLTSATTEKLFTTGEKSIEEKLYTLYIDSKHMDRMIYGDQIPKETTSGIWITNNGMASNRSNLTFIELFEILQDLRKIAKKLASLGS